MKKTQIITNNSEMNKKNYYSNRYKKKHTVKCYQ